MYSIVIHLDLTYEGKDLCTCTLGRLGKSECFLILSNLFNLDKKTGVRG